MKIAIVGGGPWGITVLERLIINGNMQPDTHISIDVYDPRDPAFMIPILTTISGLTRIICR